MNKRPVQVGIYVPHGDLPDARGFSPAIVAWETGRRLVRFDPLFVCAQENLQRPRSEAHPSIMRIREGRLYRRFFRKLTRLDPFPLHRRAASLARGLSPALWHAHQLEFPVDDFLSALGRRIPVLVHAHVTNQHFHPERGAADRYLAVSHYVRNRLILDQGYPAERVVVVPNGVDTALFRPAEPDEKEALRQRWGVPEGAVVVLFAGRKQEVKGFDLFLTLAQRLSRRLDHVFWLAVGPEPQSAHLEPSHATCVQQRRDLLKTGLYKELDALPQFVAAELFRLSDVLIAPSRTETQGMVMIEGMASGLITLSTAVGGVKESIRHGQTGFLLSEPGNVEELEALTTLVLERLDSLSSLRSAARAEAVGHYAWPVVTARLEQIYQEALEN